MINLIPTTLDCTFEGDTLPKYDKEGDSAMDICAWKFQEVSKGELLLVQDFNEDGYILRPLERILVKSGLCVDFPEGIDCTCRPRSGMTLKHGIVTQIGMIDGNYRGDIGLIVINMSNEDYVIKRGERLGQIRFSSPIFVKLKVVDNIRDTNRGTNGFGSSGK
jgi:dUTP pyrophosphatase